MGRLEGKVIIVTGSGSGFGRGIVKKATSEGARVLGIDINEAGNKETSSLLTPTAQFARMEGDAGSEQTWHSALKMAHREFSTIPDTVVNCAGYVHIGADAHTVPEEDFDRVWQVNVKPLYMTVKVLVPFWIANGVPGHVINIGSIGSQRPRASTIWYTASKGALDTATEGLAGAYAKDRIRFNIVRPSFGNTPMAPRVVGGEDSAEGRAKRLATLPLGRLCEPEDVANMTVFLASDEANYIT
ncbi:uncharacterized protein Z520_05879 [Fonsecaea multimorphosa CBS 102226]|uniref:Uncharacterized protein n=1 Tax=Fonsecaea multimorphosa CBS 102226 TaxID=1442371 RepID=A0A0D2KPD9_9EURO|nr:uncharacterized protein Z520_05879 [Fonsecaea multimorphosa CBS 102226]KIX98578.1 hypothetical protein Z520_05879 [Fonsecaea multimorphosa CBS 102226]OAL24770.1 hypothetical protein AYO22_05559 [Fonsecaea multimorphosa]